MNPTRRFAFRHKLMRLVVFCLSKPRTRQRRNAQTPRSEELAGRKTALSRALHADQVGSPDKSGFAPNSTQSREPSLRVKWEIAQAGNYAGAHRPWRLPTKKAQEELTGQCGHFGLVRLQTSWPWRFRSKYARARASNFSGTSASRTTV